MTNLWGGNGLTVDKNCKRNYELCIMNYTLNKFVLEYVAKKLYNEQVINCYDKNFGRKSFYEIRSCTL